MKSLLSAVLAVSCCCAASAAQPEGDKAAAENAFTAPVPSTNSVLPSPVYRSGCPKAALDSMVPLPDVTGPTLKGVGQTTEYPDFTDDMNYAGITGALETSLAYWNKRPDTAAIQIGNDTYNAVHIRKSLKAMIAILEKKPSAKEAKAAILKDFTIYESVADDGSNSVTITGYYEADINVSRTKTAEATHPIMLRPAGLVKTNSTEEFPYDYGMENADGGKTPAPSREQIENGALAGKNLELVWSAHTADIMLMQIQGSGYLRFPDGTFIKVGFDGANGWPFKSVQRALMDCGEIPSMNFVNFIKYLKSQPPARETTLVNINPRYTFFKEADPDTPAHGAIGLPLTPERSMAVDPKPVPLGLPAYLVSKRPVADGNGGISGFADFARFMTTQDTGSAIRGPGRVDLFWGNGRRAETEASSMKAAGKLYLFVLKK